MDSDAPTPWLLAVGPHDGPAQSLAAQLVRGGGLRALSVESPASLPAARARQATPPGLVLWQEADGQDARAALAALDTPAPTVLLTPRWAHAHAAPPETDAADAAARIALLLPPSDAALQALDLVRALAPLPEDLRELDRALAALRASFRAAVPGRARELQAAVHALLAAPAATREPARDAARRVGHTLGGTAGTYGLAAVDAAARATLQALHAWAGAGPTPPDALRAQLEAAAAACVAAAERASHGEPPLAVWAPAPWAEALARAAPQLPLPLHLCAGADALAAAAAAPAGVALALAVLPDGPLPPLPGGGGVVLGARGGADGWEHLPLPAGPERLAARTRQLLVRRRLGG